MRIALAGLFQSDVTNQLEFIAQCYNKSPDKIVVEALIHDPGVRLIVNGTPFPFTMELGVVTGTTEMATKMRAYLERPDIQQRMATMLRMKAELEADLAKEFGPDFATIETVGLECKKLMLLAAQNAQ